MHILKKIIDFYINSSVHVALSAFSLTVMTYHFLEIPLQYNVTSFAFFGTIVSYNFVKYDALIRVKKLQIKTEMKLIILLSFLSVLVCSYLFFKMSFSTKIGSSLLFFLILLYTLPFFPNKNNARNWKGVKIYMVALTWVGVTVVLPVLNSEIVFSVDVLYMCAQRFLLIFVMVLVFDIVDVLVDDFHLQTVPQQIGVKKTKKLGFFLLFLLLILELFFSNTHHYMPLLFKLLVCVSIGFFLYFANEKRSRYYASFWLESVPIIWLLLLLISTK